MARSRRVKNRRAQNWGGVNSSDARCQVFSRRASSGQDTGVCTARHGVAWGSSGGSEYDRTCGGGSRGSPSQQFWGGVNSNGCVRTLAFSSVHSRPGPAVWTASIGVRQSWLSLLGELSNRQNAPPVYIRFLRFSACEMMPFRPVLMPVALPVIPPHHPWTTRHLCSAPVDTLQPSVVVQMGTDRRCNPLCGGSQVVTTWTMDS